MQKEARSPSHYERDPSPVMEQEILCVYVFVHVHTYMCTYTLSHRERERETEKERHIYTYTQKPYLMLPYGEDGA